MDSEYLKSVPKTGRDHYRYNKPPPLHPYNNDRNKKGYTSDTNSLMVSSDQPTKISAEEVIRNYTNANFMPQKQASDRL